MENAVLHVVLLSNENFRRDEVVGVRKRSSTSVFVQEEVDLQVAEEEADIQVVEDTNHEKLGLGLGFSPNLFSLFPLQPSMCLRGYKVFNGKLFLFFFY